MTIVIGSKVMWEVQHDDCDWFKLVYLFEPYGLNLGDRERRGSLKRKCHIIFLFIYFLSVTLRGWTMVNVEMNLGYYLHYGAYFSVIVLHFALVILL